LVQEAELGERIMRALILRRVGLLESGASGPVIITPLISLVLVRGRLIRLDLRSQYRASHGG
jgi:thioredoxin reductase (NADPH)